MDGDATTCPHCGKGTDTGKGEVTGVRVRRIMRTRLDKEGRALDGNLYARHELESGLTYRGHLGGQHSWLAQPRQIWLGGRTSTCGLAAIHVADEPAGLVARTIPASPRPDGALVIRFASPAVIVDDAGRPTLDPATEILRVLGLAPAALRESRCWARPTRVVGHPDAGRAAAGTGQHMEGVVPRTWRIHHPYLLGRDRRLH